MVISRATSGVFLVGLLLILLPTLAVLQYRWIGEVSAAERDRLESSLRVASDRFAADFDAELAKLSNAFQMREGVPDSAIPIIDRYQAWLETTPQSRLIRSIYLFKNSPDNGSGFYKADFKSGELQSIELPPDLQNIRDRFRPGPFDASSSADTLKLMTTIFRPGRPFGGPRPDDFGQRGRGPDRGPGPEGPGPGGPGNPGGPGARVGAGGPGGGAPEGALIIELDRDVMLKEFIPSLKERHFSSHDETEYRIAIVTQGDRPRVLYSSAGEWTPEDVATPDSSVNLFGSGPPPPGNGAGNRRNGRGRGPGPRGLQATIVGQPWQLLAKHRSGSLETAVEELRQRNLAVSFGILLVLGASLITVIVSSQRARTLGKLQMEFAAGVSHELRTPLAVIRSAAHNLRSGIVRDKESVEQYASIVQEEARRLSDMVEEVLLYSETQSGRKKYNLQPIDVNEAIERAITNLSPAIDLEKCELTTRIDPDLPPVKADPAALAQCVQNLLSNAVKYGKKGGKAEIEIVGQKDAGSRDVRLSVIDHGSGIEAVDQRHLFEAFYRGMRVGSNVPGNGLGLHLVQRIMQAQGGRVTYSPAAHGGASFTLHIPAA